MQSSPVLQAASTELPVQNQAQPSDSDLCLYCCVCFQPLSSPPSDGEGDDPSPFWLTSCGHITCATHIFPEGAPARAARSKHTCPYCQSREVSITRLGVGETPTYLQDYFRPTNELLNDFCGAMTFQYNNLQRAAAHFRKVAQDYRERTEKHRVVLKGVRDELAMAGLLKRENERLKEENESLKGELEKLRSRLRKYEANPGQRVQSSSNILSEPKQASQARVSSPQATIPQKRKSPHQEAGTPENSAAIERRFREEINARQAMPPPRAKIQHGRNSIHESLPQKTPVYQRDPPRNIYTPAKKPDHTRQLEIEQQEHNLRGLNRTTDGSLSNFHREGEHISDNAHRTKLLEPQTMRMGSMRYFPRSPSTSFPTQVPSTPSRQSYSRSVNAPFQPPTLAHSRGLMSRGVVGGLRLPTAETRRPSSPLERLSLPPKPVTRNPPRSSARQNPPFYREQVSSRGTRSSHTLRGSTSYGTYESSDFPTISLDSGGLFRRGNLNR